MLNLDQDRRLHCLKAVARDMALRSAQTNEYPRVSCTFATPGRRTVFGRRAQFCKPHGVALAFEICFT